MFFRGFSGRCAAYTLPCVTRAWVLLLVDPAEPVTCQMRMGGSLQVTHLRHAAWLLEQVALKRRQSHFTGRSHFEGITWSDEHSVAVLEWSDDVCTLMFHGKHLSEFHVVTAASALRERADSLGLQQVVLQVLQGFEQAKGEARAAADIAQSLRGNGGPDPKNIVILGR